MRTERQHNDRKKEIMEKCFDCYAENGLTGTGIKTLAKECGCTSGTLYVYFKNLDELIVESTAYCMAKVEEDFMSRSPNSPSELMPISLTDFAKNAGLLNELKNGFKIEQAARGFCGGLHCIYSFLSVFCGC